MSTSRKTAAEMFPLVEAYLDGPHTRKTFCHEYGLSLSVLNYWIKRYRQERASNSHAFIEITPAHQHPMISQQPLFEVVYPHGVCLRLFQPVETTFLARMLRLP